MRNENTLYKEKTRVMVYSIGGGRIHLSASNKIIYTDLIYKFPVGKTLTEKELKDFYFEKYLNN